MNAIEEKIIELLKDNPRLARFARKIGYAELVYLLGQEAFERYVDSIHRTDKNLKSVKSISIDNLNLDNNVDLFDISENPLEVLDIIGAVIEYHPPAVPSANSMIKLDSSSLKTSFPTSLQTQPNINNSSNIANVIDIAGIVSGYASSINRRFDAMIAIELEKQQQQWLEQVGNVEGFLKDNIAKASMSDKTYNQFALDSKIAAMQAVVDECIKRGIPVDGIQDELNKYQEIMQRGLESIAANAVRDFENNMQLMKAQLSGNSLDVAAAQRDIEFASVADWADKNKNNFTPDQVAEARVLKEALIDKRYNLEVDAVQRKQNAQNPETAGIEAMRRLQERTIDYSDIMVQAFDQINNSMENHFTMMLTGAESFSAGFKNIFKDMTNSIVSMFIKMWYNQYIMKPLMNWFGRVIGVEPEQRATGGTVVGASTYLVGEAGPELFMPYASGTIVPNHRIMDAVGASNAPAVTVNVVNNTGVQANARQQEARWDGRQYVVDVVLDAYARNVSGMRDIMGTARG